MPSVRYLNAYAQIVSDLHIIVKIVRQLKNGIIIKEVTCKGLLLVKTTGMLLFTLKASLDIASKAGLNVSYSEVKSIESNEDN